MMEPEQEPPKTQTPHAFTVLNTWVWCRVFICVHKWNAAFRVHKKCGISYVYRHHLRLRIVSGMSGLLVGHTVICV